MHLPCVQLKGSESQIERTTVAIEISKVQKHDKNIETFPELSTAGLEDQEKV